MGTLVQLDVPQLKALLVDGHCEAPSRLFIWGKINQPTGEDVTVTLSGLRVFDDLPRFQRPDGPGTYVTDLDGNEVPYWKEPAERPHADCILVPAGHEERRYLVGRETLELALMALKNTAADSRDAGHEEQADVFQMAWGEIETVLTEGR